MFWITTEKNQAPVKNPSDAHALEANVALFDLLPIDNTCLILRLETHLSRRPLKIEMNMSPITCRTSW